jgi:hypothetical protein
VTRLLKLSVRVPRSFSSSRRLRFSELELIIVVVNNGRPLDSGPTGSAAGKEPRQPEHDAEGLGPEGGSCKRMQGYSRGAVPSTAVACGFQGSSRVAVRLVQ